MYCVGLALIQDEQGVIGVIGLIPTLLLTLSHCEAAVHALGEAAVAGAVVEQEVYGKKSKKVVARSSGQTVKQICGDHTPRGCLLLGLCASSVSL